MFFTAALCVSFAAQAQIAFRDVSSAAGFAGSDSETWGAAWGDVNGDGYPDVFFSNHRNRATLYRNNRDGTFTEVSRLVDASATPGWTGARADVDTHGATWGDVDNDGDDDLIESVESSTDRLHVNVGGVLYDRTVQYGLDHMLHSATRHSVLFDYTGDGRLDLASVSLERPSLSPQLVGATFGPESLLSCASDGQWAQLADVYPGGALELLCAPRNGTFPRVTTFGGGAPRDVSAAFQQFSPVIDAATLDYDRDLRPDLFVLRGPERPSDAYLSSSQRFEAQFITAANKGKAVTFRTSGVLTVTASLSVGDDPDGDPSYVDIGSGKWSPGSLTFQLRPDDSRNWGIGTGSPGLNIGYFTGSGTWKISQSNSSYSYSYVQVSSTEPIEALTFYGASAADVGSRPLLLRNTGTTLAVQSGGGFANPLRCQSAVAGDFDNDMDEDLFLACTGGARNLPNRLFRNDGGTFTEVAKAGGAVGRTGAAVGSHAGTSESVVVADYDRDGFLDLLVTNGNNMRPVSFGGPKQLFRNVGNANRWIEFDLVGTRSNRDATGAQVYVRAGGITQYREQNGGYHRWSQNFRRVHFGLASYEQADVTVRWPDGTSTAFGSLQASRLYRLGQDGSVVVVPR